MDNSETSPKTNVKYDWYQTETFVVVTILVRNVEKEKTAVTFSHHKLSVHLYLLDNTEHFREIILAHEVLPEGCSFAISSAKVEVKLKKSIGVRWETLERSETIPDELPQVFQVSPTSSDPHKYPTSTGKNWSAIEQGMKEEEARERPVAEEALNKLFRDIYGKGDDSVKRAMTKSYMESGGTVLSTNWNEISKEQVPIKPPQGLEWKKWDT